MNICCAEKMKLSWSQVSTYRGCPAKWRFSRTAPPDFTSAALHFGKAVHRALELFYSRIGEARRPDPEEVFEAFLEAWTQPVDPPIRFSSRESEESLSDMALTMLRTFLDEVSPGEVAAVELPFEIEISPGVSARGVVDLVEIKDGKWWIVDHKACRNAPSDEFGKEQLALYRMALRETGFIPVGVDVAMRYDALRKLKSRGEFTSVDVEVSPSEERILRREFEMAARGIDSGVFYHNRSGFCSSCPWSISCAQHSPSGR